MHTLLLLGWKCQSLCTFPVIFQLLALERLIHHPASTYGCANGVLAYSMWLTDDAPCALGRKIKKQAHLIGKDVLWSWKTSGLQLFGEMPKNTPFEWFRIGFWLIIIAALYFANLTWQVVYENIQKNEVDLGLKCDIFSSQWLILAKAVHNHLGWHFFSPYHSQLLYRSFTAVLQKDGALHSFYPSC